MTYRVLLTIRIRRENEPSGSFHVSGEVQMEPKDEGEFSLEMEETEGGEICFAYFDPRENLNKHWISGEAFGEADNCDPDGKLLMDDIIDKAKQSFVAAGFTIVNFESKRDSSAEKEAL